MLGRRRLMGPTRVLINGSVGSRMAATGCAGSFDPMGIEPLPFGWCAHAENRFTNHATCKSSAPGVRRAVRGFPYVGIFPGLQCLIGQYFSTVVVYYSMCEHTPHWESGMIPVYVTYLASIRARRRRVLDSVSVLVRRMARRWNVL